LQEIALERFAQRLAWSQDLVLADDVIECARAYPFGERSSRSRGIRTIRTPRTIRTFRTTRTIRTIDIVE
jgi:hypothetical protein